MSISGVELSKFFLAICTICLQRVRGNILILAAYAWKVFRISSILKICKINNLFWWESNFQGLEDEQSKIYLHLKPSLVLLMEGITCRAKVIRNCLKETWNESYQLWIFVQCITYLLLLYHRIASKQSAGIKCLKKNEKWKVEVFLFPRDNDNTAIINM